METTPPPDFDEKDAATQKKLYPADLFRDENQDDGENDADTEGSPADDEGDEDEQEYFYEEDPAQDLRNAGNNWLLSGTSTPQSQFDPYYTPLVNLTTYHDFLQIHEDGHIMTDEEIALTNRRRAVGTWKRERGGIRDKWGHLLLPEPGLKTDGFWLSFPTLTDASLRGANFSADHISPTFTGQFQVNMLDTELAALSFRARTLFGRDLAPNEWGELAGVPDGARVEVRALPDGILIQGHPESSIPVFLLLIERARLGDAFLQYSRPAVHLIDPTQKSAAATFADLAPLMLFHSARKCNQLGIDAILCEAEGTPDTPSITGYQFWPHLGFETPILPEFKNDWGKIPPAFRVETVLDLYALPDGPEVWALGGTGRMMVFQTAPASKSQNALAAYLTPSLSQHFPSCDHQGLTSHDREWMQKQIPGGDMTTHFFHPFSEEYLREGGEDNPTDKTRRERVNLWIAQLLSSASP